MHGLGCADHPGVGLERKRAAIQRQCEEEATYGQLPMGMDEGMRTLGMEMVRAWRAGTGLFAQNKTNNNAPCGCNGKGE